MAYLLDTDVCVFWLRGHAAIRERLLTVGVEQCAISVITLAELRYGAALSKQPAIQHEHVTAFARVISPLAFEPGMAAIFGDLKAHLKKQGLLLEDADLLIAATALYTQRILITSNARHFARLPGLQFVSWLT